MYYYSRAAEPGGGGVLAPPPNFFFSNTQKVPFFLSENCPFFLSKKCPFKVKHAPFLLTKRAFSSIFKSLNANFLRGTCYYREGTKWEKGHLYALMGHLSCHIWALIATADPGNSGALALPNFHTQKVPLFLSKKCHFKVKHAPSSVRKKTGFLNIFVPKCAFFAHYGAQL